MTVFPASSYRVLANVYTTPWHTMHHQQRNVDSAMLGSLQTEHGPSMKLAGQCLRSVRATTSMCAGDKLVSVGMAAVAWLQSYLESFISCTIFYCPGRSDRYGFVLELLP